MAFQEEQDKKISSVSNVGPSRSFFGELKSRVEFVQRWSDMLAKGLTNSFGTVWFLSLNLILIFGWVILNLGFMSGIQPFDPYPFNALMISLQSFGVVLSVTVLISQNLQWRNAEIRRQIEFEVNVRAEQEITKILKMVDEIHAKLGIVKVDKELEQMKEKIDIAEIKEAVEEVVEKEKI